MDFQTIVVIILVIICGCVLFYRSNNK